MNYAKTIASYFFIFDSIWPQSDNTDHPHTKTVTDKRRKKYVQEKYYDLK